MDAQTLELDRFGPWVLEVGPGDPPPPLFVPYLDRTAQPLMAIKVPRRIERRDARPGMDLYDYLLCLYPDEVVILQRVEREVRTRACGYRDVRSLSLVHALLHGVLRLDTTAGVFELPFSTSSDGPVRRAVDLVRERYHRPAVALGTTSGSVSADVPLSFGFERLLAEVRRDEPAMRPLALQGTLVLGARGARTWRHALARVTGRRLLESMHCADGRELLVIDRGKRFAYRWESTYGRVTTWIPLANVRGVERHDDDEVTVLTVRTDVGAVSHAFTRSNGSVEAYRGYLAEAASGRP